MGIIKSKIPIFLSSLFVGSFVPLLALDSIYFFVASIIVSSLGISLSKYSLHNLVNSLSFILKSDAEKTSVLYNWLVMALDKIAVAKDFLDRAGFKPVDEVSVSGNVNNPFMGLTTEELKKMVYDE